MRGVGGVTVCGTAGENARHGNQIPAGSSLHLMMHVLVPMHPATCKESMGHYQIIINDYDTQTLDTRVQKMEQGALCLSLFSVK